MNFNLKKETHLFFLIGLLALSYFTYKIIIWFERLLGYEVKELVHLLHVFTVPAVFVLYIKLFDKYLWKLPIWRQLGIINFPNVDGTYKGEFVSSYADENGNPVKGEMTLIIEQTASDVKIIGKFNQSESVSIEAFFAHNDYKNEPCLYYFYKNKPGNNATPTMHAHEGSAVLCYDEKDHTLEGEYYSGRDRNNHGDINVKKV